MSIINYGSLIINHVYRVDRFVLPGETITSGSLRQTAGGRGLNQSIALARAGVSVTHAGKIGLDGLILKETLKNNGVDTCHIDITNTTTGHTIVQVDGAGEKGTILYSGTNGEITEAEVEQVLEYCETGDILLVQNETNSVRHILEYGLSRGMKIAFNPAPMTEEVRTLPLSSLHWIFVNEAEAKALLNVRSVEMIGAAIRELFPGTAFILTQGPNGSSCYLGKSHYSIGSEQVTVVDTSGADDTFIGYFLAGMAAGKQIIDCLRQASSAAAICVTRKGAPDSIPTMDEVNRFIQRQTEIIR